jgi:hypothetical protein
MNRKQQILQLAGTSGIIRAKDAEMAGISIRIQGRNMSSLGVPLYFIYTNFVYLYRDQWM